MTRHTDSEAESKVPLAGSLATYLAPVVSTLLTAEPQLAARLREVSRVAPPHTRLETARQQLLAAPGVALAVAAEVLAYRATSDDEPEAIELELHAAWLAGEALRQLGRPEASPVLEAAFKEGELLESLPGIEAALCESLGRLALETGDFQSAGTFFHGAGQLFLEAGDAASHLRRFLRLAQVAGDEGAYTASQCHLAWMGLFVQEDEDPSAFSELGFLIHWYASERDGWRTCIEERATIELVAVRRLDAGLRLRHQWLLARCWAAAGEVERAADGLLATRSRMRATGRLRDYAASLADLVGWLERLGRTEEAAEAKAETERAIKGHPALRAPRLPRSRAARLRRLAGISREQAGIS